ncbi:MAG: 3-dehydroquinate dehydratase [Saprospiraceae bacterium]|nr:3-dehydroquinate dehydratase [Saprospiraceae bacterium]
MAHIVILNGPNLNLIGKRQPEIYGTMGFDEYIPYLKGLFLPHLITYHQSNHEGTLIDWLHQYGFDAHGLILNAGGLTHTSVSLADAVAAIKCPVVEVHISNINEREIFRKNSYLKPVCVHSVVGKGLHGYELAIDHILEKLAPESL